jgi:hypothetical protein
MIMFHGGGKDSGKNNRATDAGREGGKQRFFKEHHHCCYSIPECSFFWQEGNDNFSAIEQSLKCLK